MKHYINGIIIALGFFLVSGVLYVGIKPQDSVGVFGSSNINFSTTNSTRTVSSTPVRAITNNTGRNFAKVCNPSGNNIYATVFPGTITSVTSTVGATGYFASSTGILVAPTTCFETNLTGDIWLSSNSSTATSVTMIDVTNK